MFELLYSCQFLYLLNKAPSLNGIVCYSTVLCTVPKELLIGVPNFLNVGSTTKLKPPPFSAWNFTNSTLYRSYLTSTHPFQVNVLIKRCMKLTHSTTDTPHQFTNTHPTEFPKLHLYSESNFLVNYLAKIASTSPHQHPNPSHHLPMPHHN